MGRNPRARRLARLLKEYFFAGPTAGRQYEIVVVDDASTDQTAKVARDAGAKVVSINRRQIAAARNAGARAAKGDILFFVDADTRINEKHISGAVAALEKGCSGGGARVKIGGTVPLWARILFKLFCAIYFAFNLGAGAFLLTVRKNFDAVGGFDESLFIGEEVYLSIALRKLGRFRILREPIITSGRKLRMYSAMASPPTSSSPSKMIFTFRGNLPPPVCMRASRALTSIQSWPLSSTAPRA